MKTDIVIIDSGVDYRNKLFINDDFKGINLISHCDDNDIMDYIGHGTAVYYLLKKYAGPVDVFVIKVFNEEYETTLDDLLAALEYVDNNVECKIVHLSNGITYCEDIQALRLICKKIID